MDHAIGKAFGAYTAIEQIGEGGMAVVYKGYQESLNRYVAIKVLKGELAHDQEFITRFRREALAVAALSHPNILHVYDAGMAHGLYYIVMDYADGGSLRGLHGARPPDTESAIAITAQLADALDYAHRQGIVHRDVKPSNVLMSRDGRPLLTDFGIAKALDQSTHLTRTGTSIGTPEYMAPEQAQGQSIDGRTDIYALGIVLYEMLTGFVPFSAPTPVAALYKQINEPPPPLRQVNVNVPPWLEAVVDKALAKRPEERFQRASELATALRERRTPPGVGRGAAAATAAAEAATRQQAATAAERRGKKGGSKTVPILVGLILILAAALVAGGIYVALRGSGQGGVGEVSVTTPAYTATEAPTPTVIPTSTPTTAPSTASAVELAAPSPVVLVVTATPLPTLPPTGTPEPSATSTSTAAAPQETPTPKPTTAPREPGVIADFEDFGTWRRGDEANGTFTQSSAETHQGSYSGKLSYDFGTTGNDYVVFQQTHAISGEPDSLSAWVHGDGEGHFLNAWIRDSGGQTWQVPLGRVTHTGWQKMEGSLDVNQEWPWTHIDGPDNGVVDYPVSFIAFVLDDHASSYTGKGTLYLDDFRADAGAPSSPGATAAPAPTKASAVSAAGRIAFSAGGALHVFDAKTGKRVGGPSPNMRQPDFRSDGQVILANGEGGGLDSIWSLRADGSRDREQSKHPDDFRPFFSPIDPGRFIFDSTRIRGRENNLFVGNLDRRGQDESRQALSFGGGNIIGTHPTWMQNDMIVYRGCDYGFGGGANCGLFTVPSWGGVPTHLTGAALTEVPGDGHGSKVAFMSQRDGNWEAYIINLDGSGLRNLSNSPSSRDGLPAFSPDGKLVAFASDKGGSWAMWAVGTNGSGLTKLFDLPAPPTGDWTDERISWGP
jgi:hypothetical protein